MVPLGSRKRSVVLASVFGAALIAVAVALNVSWIVVNWRTGLLLLVGVISFAVLIAGLILNTGFLIREIRRSERHDAFIHAVTHELKTPLASIGLYLQTLQQRDLAPEKRREFIDVMLSDADRLETTIEQILLAGKTSMTRRVVDATDIDLSDVVAECLHTAQVRHHLDNSELALVDRLAAGAPVVVSGDREELRAAVTNLIDNAIKYSNGRVHVAVELAKVGVRKVAVRVRDHGIGIDTDELKHVFRRFYRVGGPRTARVRGTGLGLSIVSAVARRHGGRVYAASEGQGTGSTFTIELPLKRS